MQVRRDARRVYTHIRSVPRRRDENADAETGIGTSSVPDLGLAVENGPRGHHVRMWTPSVI